MKLMTGANLINQDGAGLSELVLSRLRRYTTLTPRNLGNALMVAERFAGILAVSLG